MSLTKKAENNPRHADYRDQQQDRAARMFHHALGHQGEKSGELQIGYHDHHSEQQNDGVEIDGDIGFIQRQRVRSYHEAGADDGRAGPVDPKSGQPADSQHQVGDGEDDDGGHQYKILVRMVPAIDSSLRFSFQDASASLVSRSITT